MLIFRLHQVAERKSHEAQLNATLKRVAKIVKTKAAASFLVPESSTVKVTRWCCPRTDFRTDKHCYFLVMHASGRHFHCLRALVHIFAMAACKRSKHTTDVSSKAMTL